MDQLQLTLAFRSLCAENAASESPLHRMGRMRLPMPISDMRRPASHSNDILSEVLPENVAASYELYAYAMRAQSCGRPSRCSRDTCLKIVGATRTAIRDDMKLIIVGTITSGIGVCIGILGNKYG